LIPNSTVVDATVENLSARSRRRQRFFLRLASNTPREKIEEFIADRGRISLPRGGSSGAEKRVRLRMDLRDI